jgi:tyrosyl-tRNA synthetase
MIMQAYDFVELYRRYGCRLQSAGSDQWGNIVSGIDLGRRVESAHLFGLTTPLITTASGAKMGKTAAGAVWLNADQRSPYEYWQFWRNSEDKDVGRFLRLFTDLPLGEITRLEKLEGAELNQAKIVLATEATSILHGRSAADEAAETARQVFVEGVAAEGLPVVEVRWSADDSGVDKGWIERHAYAILKKAGLASSFGDARRKIAENNATAVKINDEVISDPERLFRTSDVDPKTGLMKVQYGKKKIVLVRPI